MSPENNFGAEDDDDDPGDGAVTNHHKGTKNVPHQARSALLLSRRSVEEEAEAGDIGMTIDRVEEKCRLLEHCLRMLLRRQQKDGTASVWPPRSEGEDEEAGCGCDVNVSELREIIAGLEEEEEEEKDGDNKALLKLNSDLNRELGLVMAENNELKAAVEDLRQDVAELRDIGGDGERRDKGRGVIDFNPKVLDGS